MRLIDRACRIITIFASILIVQVSVAQEHFRTELVTEEEIRAWAEDWVFGAQVFEFKRFGEQLLVVKTTHTSGARSSGISIYHWGYYDGEVSESGEELGYAKFKLIAFRNSVYGFAEINEDAQGINVTVQGAPIISLSWMSLKLPPGTR